MAELTGNEFESLLEDYLNEETRPENKERFEEYLRMEEYRMQFLEKIQQESFVRRVYSDFSNSSVEKPVIEKVKTFPLFNTALLAIAACLIISFSLLSLIDPAPQVQYSSVLISDQVNCQWSFDHSENENLPLGTISLREGLAKLTFKDGSTAVAEGPLTFAVLDDTHLFLETGNIFVHGKPGFRIDTSKAKIIDHGTKFGVYADPAKEVLVQVYEGQVETIYESANTMLNKGDAVKLDYAKAVTRKIDFKRERFVQVMPELPNGVKSGHEHRRPYNVAAYESITATKVNNKPVIDGDLSDWSNTQKFISRCREPYNESYYVEGMMMWSEDGLYIGAQIGDLHPMSSKIDPDKDPNSGWLSGGVQVRISLDKKLGWPAKTAQNFSKKPSANNEKIHHLTMWYFSPGKRACLHLSRSMNYLNQPINPDGYQGAFKKFSNGKGYTLEYYIPWELIPGDIPTKGDILPGCWNIHWGNEKGTDWKGRLIENLNPDVAEENFFNASSWGKFIFE